MTLKLESEITRDDFLWKLRKSIKQKHETIFRKINYNFDLYEDTKSCMNFKKEKLEFGLQEYIDLQEIKEKIKLYLDKNPEIKQIHIAKEISYIADQYNKDIEGLQILSYSGIISEFVELINSNDPLLEIVNY